MRHRKKGRKLNRTASHKKAMLRNLANQLFENKEIKTTTAKAKEARPTVERLITYAKKGDLHHRRLAFSFLRQKSAIKTLFDEIAPTFTDRQGGYTRVIKLGRRLGDGAPMSILQLVGFETLGDTVKKETKKKTKKKVEKPEEEAGSVAKSTEPAAAAPIETTEEDVAKSESVKNKDQKSDIADVEIQEAEIVKEDDSVPEEIAKEEEKPVEGKQEEVAEKEPEEKTDEPEKPKSDKEA